MSVIFLLIIMLSSISPTVANADPAVPESAKEDVEETDLSVEDDYEADENSEEHNDSVEEYDEEDVEEEWFVQFYTRCKELTPDGLCGIHADRPEIC